MSDGVAELQHGVQSCRTDDNKHEQQTNQNNKQSAGLLLVVADVNSPSSVRVWLPETPSVSVTTTEYLPRSSLSGLVKVSLELRNKYSNY